jgi:methylmalonyl-CoA epimerase
MSQVQGIDHIAFVVDNIEKAVEFWRDALNLDLERVEEIEEQESIVAFLPTGGTEVELVQPTTDDSGIARFLRKRGPGFHHVCFEVDDVISTLEQLREKEVRLINETPTAGSGGKLVAFIHPESTGGVLIELSQKVEPGA